MNEKPVFYDVKGRRKRQAVGVGAFLGIVSAVLLTIVVIGLFLLPFIPGLPGSKNPVILRATHPPLINTDEVRQTGLILSKRISRLKKTIRESSSKTVVPKASSEGPIVAAFYEPWQDTSINSFRANANHLTHVMPTWLTLTSNGYGLDESNFDLANDPRTQDVEHIADKNGVNVFPVLSNMVEGTPNESEVAKLLASKAHQQILISKIVTWLTQNKFEGINIDFEELKDKDYEKLPAFFHDLTEALHKEKLGTSFDLEVSEVPDSSDMANNVDFVVLMDYDFSSENSNKPGPIAPLGWFTQNIVQALKYIDANKLVVGIGNYGYDWNKKSTAQAQSISYQDAAMLADESRDDLPVSQRITFDPSSFNSFYTYDDDNGDPHEVWLLDGPSAYNQYKVAHGAQVRGEALWELGTEDPSIWNFYSAHQYGVPNAQTALSKLSFPYEINFHGNGEILWVPKGFGESKPGNRVIETEDGLVKSVTYKVFPTPIVIDRLGKDPKKPPYEVALTFDDGPDGTYTPQILQTLEQLHVPGTFFVIGENAISNPGLIRREYNDGFEIGSHTFTHPNMGEISDLRAHLEIDATQRAIQSIIGRSTLLFRPPYNADVEPTSLDEVKPVVMASDLGYYSVGESVDPQDWNLQVPGKDGTVVNKTAEEIANDVMQGVEQHEGSVVLLHDAGGDRHLTVEALKIFVPKLKAAGFKFVTASKLMNESREEMMPHLTGKDLLLLPFDRVFFYSWYIIATFLTLAFLTAIGLGIGRILLITPMAMIANKRDKIGALPPLVEEPLVSVIIAAYNEEEVIVGTVQSVLGSFYKSLEVIVVDDGSKDDTYREVSDAFANNSKVLVLHQENGGKASALNYGMEHSRGDIYVYLDADTILASDAIPKLVRHFSDEKVGAVAGNVKVGNRMNTLTRLQAVEYIASQNLDRRAYAYINTVTVVPGAIGAWRKTAVESAGGYTSDTLAEDMDLTWRVRLAGWQIDNESGAIAYTEAPSTLKSFFKQRFRWTFGTLQCLFKHRNALGKNGLFGRFALPMLWVYQFGIQIIAPFVDLQLLYSVIVFGSAWATHSIFTRDWRPMADASQTMAYIGFMYALFFGIEFVSALIAFRMDREKKSLLWWLFLQRLVYRQVLYVVVWKALWQALKGVRTGWGKFERKGTVLLAATQTRGHEDPIVDREQVGS